MDEEKNKMMNMAKMVSIQASGINSTQILSELQKP